MKPKIIKYLVAFSLLVALLLGGSTSLAQTGMSVVSKGEGTKESPKSMSMKVVTPEGDIMTVDIKISNESISFIMGGLPNSKKGTK